MWPTDWPAPARTMATAIEAARTAAHTTDAAAFDTAITDLAALPADQVGAVLSATVRELLETAHPDGLTGDDVSIVLTDVVRRAAWLPRLDPAAVLTTLTGALGVDDPRDPDTHPTDPHPAAILLIDHLATRARVPAHESLRRALDEIARAETVEMP